MSETRFGEGDLATARPDATHRAGAFSMFALFLVAFALLAPFAQIQFARYDAFIAAYEAALAISYLVTSVLLFAHFHRARAWAVLILACGYLFNALIIVPHLLTYPGVFGPAGMLGGGPQSAIWLYGFWHEGFALFIFAFGFARWRAPGARAPEGVRGVLAGVALTAALVVALALVATAGEHLLPTLTDGRDHTMLVSKGVSPFICLTVVAAMAMLWPQVRKGALDLWLFVVAAAWLFDVLLNAVVGTSRFDLGWYGGRLFGLCAAVLLLVLLLAEFSRLDKELETRTAELRASQALIQTFFEYSSECYAVLVRGPDGVFRYEAINAATLALYGKTRDEVIGRTTAQVLSPAAALAVDAALDAALRGGEPQRYERAQGGRMIEALATPAPTLASPSSPEAVPQRVIVSARDITERRRLEDQLRHSHKMEAVGQLTGGIAHDFNNMLAIIMGSLDIVRRRLANGATEGLSRWIDNAAEGAQRASTLTSRLLSFSRRQPLSPKSADLNDLVAAASQLLRQTIPESVRIETVLAGGLWRVYADPEQIENCLINLAINARDAMPEGGKITIETRNSDLDERYARDNADVAPGQYAMVSVTDSGEGMTADVIERAFEPFFSTKAPGKGTGLGLSQVFGFIKQSKGHVKIYSEVGHGTTVKLYLPRHVEAPAAAPRRIAKKVLPAARGELVLVVEDEPGVRAMSTQALTELGFNVIAAESPREALRLLGENPQIELLFTDVVMPEMTGRQLADQAREMRPSLKVLYTTGYSRNAVVHNGVVDAGTHLLAKPFTIEELAAKVAEAMGG